MTMMDYQTKFKPGNLLRTTALIGAHSVESCQYTEIPPNTILLFLKTAHNELGEKYYVVLRANDILEMWPDVLNNYTDIIS